VSFDASILVIMAIFWVTYLILRVCFFKPMVALLEEREGRVATAQQTWEQAFAETQKRLDEERALLAETRRRAMTARAERRREAQERRLSTLAEVKKTVQGELAEASAAIDRQVRVERQTLAERVRGLADEIVQRLLGTAA
jgi:F0F1-type ATP synthase membrane subunit b/b'